MPEISASDFEEARKQLHVSYRCAGESYHQWQSIGDGEREVCLNCSTERKTHTICPQCGEKTKDLHYVSPHMRWAGCFDCFCKIADRVEDAAKMVSVVAKAKQEIAEIPEEDNPSE